MSIDRYDELHVVSDLHLGGEIKDGRNFQIFNQGERLGKFITNLAERPVGKIGLVLNGDIVDFLAESPGCYLDTENAIRKLGRVYTDKAFIDVWNALSEFIKLARKPWAFKPRDEWPPGAEPAFAGEAEVNSA